MPPKKIKGAQGGADAEEFKAEENIQLNWTWKKKGTLIYGDSGTKPSELILSMDMDDTLIKTKSGAKFGKDATDWILWHKIIPEKIKEYHKNGYKIVIFTNQNGISKGHTSEAVVKSKIQKIVAHIGVEFQVFIASEDDEYRKPNLGMWRVLTKEMNGDKKIDLQKSYYIGDAAGRPKSALRKADHSDTDYKFAVNAGMQFRTPEQFFLGQNETLPKFEWDPKSLMSSEGGAILKGKPKDAKIASDTKEMVIFVGPPAAGKSTFRKNHLPDYVHVNNDTLGSKKKCLAVAEAALKEGKSVVIDNTNPEKATRKEYIDLAKTYDYPVRCFFFDFPKDLSFHLDTLRKVNPHRTHHSKRVGSIPIHTWHKKLEKPDKKEGFSEVEVVNFVAGPFANDLDKEIFYSHNN